VETLGELVGHQFFAGGGFAFQNGVFDPPVHLIGLGFGDYRHFGSLWHFFTARDACFWP
jgi:hypothetical protein